MPKGEHSHGDLTSQGGQFTLQDLWAEAEDEGGWWGDLKQETVRAVKRLGKASMKEEMVE